MHSHLSFSRQTEYNEKGRHRRRLIVDAMNGDGLVTFYYILALICKTKIRGVEFTKEFVKTHKKLQRWFHVKILKLKNNKENHSHFTNVSSNWFHEICTKIEIKNCFHELFSSNL